MNLKLQELKIINTNSERHWTKGIIIGVTKNSKATTEVICLQLNGRSRENFRNFWEQRDGERKKGRKKVGTLLSLEKEKTERIEECNTS